MARRKKEVEEKAEDKVLGENVIDETVNETKKTKAAKKETELVPEIVSTEKSNEALLDSVVANKEILVSTNNPIERRTPFGTEVWDPIEKRTVLKNG